MLKKNGAAIEAKEKKERKTTPEKRSLSSSRFLSQPANEEEQTNACSKQIIPESASKDNHQSYTYWDCQRQFQEHLKQQVGNSTEPMIMPTLANLFPLGGERKQVTITGDY